MTQVAEAPNNPALDIAMEIRECLLDIGAYVEHFSERTLYLASVNAAARLPKLIEQFKERTVPRVPITMEDWYLIE